MVHLSVAVALSEKAGRFPSQIFLLGSLAPDAIHIALAHKSAIKHVHLIDLAPPVAIAEIISQRLWAWLNPNLEGFAGGYLAHLLTGPALVANRHHGRSAPNSRLISGSQIFRKLYYRDTDRIDLDL